MAAQVMAPKVQWAGAGGNTQCTPCFPGPDMDHPIRDLSQSLCKSADAASLCPLP